MFKDKKQKLKSKCNFEKNQERNSGYGRWLFRTKGTAAEPWPTAEELWNDPEGAKSH